MTGSFLMHSRRSIQKNMKEKPGEPRGPAETLWLATKQAADGIHRILLKLFTRTWKLMVLYLKHITTYPKHPYFLRQQ